MSGPSLISCTLMALVLALTMPEEASSDRNVVRRNKGVGSFTVLVGFLFRRQIPDDAFTGVIDRYEVYGGEKCSDPLPPWLDFDPSTKTFIGFTRAAQVGTKTFICVKAIGRSVPGRGGPPSVSTDVFSIEVDVGLTRDFACGETDSVVLATVYVDLTLPELSKEEIFKVLNSIGAALDIAPEKIRFTRLVNRYSPDRFPVLFSGKGDSKGQKQKGARIQFQVGCSSDTITSAHPYVQFLEQKAPTGELASIIGYPVLDWTVHKGFPRGNGPKE